MTPGAKVFLTLAAIGGTLGVVALFASTEAKAAPGQPKQPKPGSNQPPDVIVPEPGTQPSGPLPQAPAVQIPPLFPPGITPVAPPSVFVPPQVQPSPQAPQTPPASQGTTFTLPNPLGGAPLGTFNPATGNVFGADGTVIGTFNPTTGMFTGTNGFTVQVPGFPIGAKPNVPTPTTPAAPGASPGVTVPLPTGPVTIPIPQNVQPSPPVSPASGTTVPADTAAMVAELLDAETRGGWNKTSPTVQVWQRSRPPLTADAKFGPGTAIAAAHEIGTLPLIRFWPANGQSKATLLSNYQEALITLANQSSDPVHAAQLRHSAQREQAQAFSTKGALPALALSDQVSLTQV